MKAAITALLVVLAVPPARAETQSVAIPHYEVDAACASRFGQTIQTKACVEAEQGSYDWLKLFWNDASTATKARCIQMAANRQPRQYGYLEACLEPRIELERTQRQGAFRYGVSQ